MAISIGPDNHGAAFGGQKSPFTLGQPRAAKKKKKKKSKFNYRDSIGKHVQTHKSKLIGTHLVVTNTCTYSDVHKHVRTQTLTLTHTHTHIQMKGIEMAANPSTLDRNQFPTWNLC